MQNLLLNDIPNEYKSMLNQIKNNTIKKIYSEFNFFYIDLLKSYENHKNFNEKEIMDTILFNYLKYFRFLTYQITSSNFNFLNFTENADIPNSDTIKVNAVICIEKECFIIENIYFSIISAIIIKLKEQNLSLLNMRNDYQNVKLSSEEKHANAEANNFCQSLNEIKKNSFVEYTILPIAGYLIRRYFYPTDFFTDQSFLIKTSEEEIIKTKIFEFIKIERISSENANQQLMEIYNLIQAYNTKSQSIDHKIFDKSEFIILRQVFFNDQALLNFVIHRESLLIFLMKELKSEKVSEDQREIWFCKQFKNRCLVRFYGFIQKGNEIIGLIYEYLVNNTLKSFVESNNNQINAFFQLDAMIRIFEGINYLQSNQLIHRDLKSENILLDSNFVPYISDFPTIRNPLTEEEIKDHICITNNIGSITYASPEQYSGDLISYPTDIYSFGILTYFLYEKNVDSFKYKFNKDFIFPKMNSNESDNIKTIYQSCTKDNQNDRIKINGIRARLLDEINLFLNQDKGLLNQMINVNKNVIIQFIYDIYSIEHLNPSEIKTINQSILNCKSFFESKIKDRLHQKAGFSISQLIKDYQIIISNDTISYDVINEILCCYFNLNLPMSKIDSKSAYVLSSIYFDVKYSSRNIYKSIHYLEIAANQNFIDAQVMLGNIFYEGNLVKRDINKSIKYFILASNQKSITAQLTLGLIFLEGQYIARDINRSIYYFSLAAHQNDPKAQIILGKIYFENKYIKRDISNSILYYSLAAKQNNIKALNQLGHFYYDNEFLKRDILKSIEYFTSAANLNEPDSQYMLGLIYSNGKYIDRDIKKSIHYLELASKQNNSNAQFVLARLYLDGKYISYDIDKALYYLTLSANLNNKHAQNDLGFIYYDGEHIVRDIKKSIHYLSLSADQNYSNALFMLGKIYYEGKYTSCDMKKSIHYLELASLSNNVDAQYLLGDIYYNGTHVLRNIDKAIHFYSLAADQKLPFAQNILGIIYSEGKYVSIDIDKAIHYFSLAADQNLLDAVDNLGHLYYNKRDILKSIKCFTYAADRKDQVAQLSLGKIYIKGEFVKRDIEKSIHYFKLAADQKNLIALYNLGNIYYNNKYIKRDIKKAIEYFSLAAKQNDSYSQFFLSQIYLRDNEEPQDIPKSIYYLTLSADQNNIDAQYVLGHIYYDGKYIARDIKKSIHYLSLAANENSIDAQIMLGIIYYLGKYIPRDIHKSINYYLMAANLNDPQAQNALGCIFYEKKYIKQDVNKSIYFFTLAAKRNNKISQYNLGYIYFFDKSFQNINQAIKYIQYSAQNQFRDAQLLLADLLLEGKYIKHDIHKAIYLYKELSSFNNHHAKNNLGVIYKNGYDQTEKSFGKAIVYFNEAIKKNDVLSMFNLSNILLDEDEDSCSKPIELLIESASQKFVPSLVLLCFFIFQKNESLKYWIKELVSYNKKSNTIIEDISHIWSLMESLISNKENFLEKYNKFRKMDFLYICHEVKSLENLKFDSDMSYLRDLNTDFYEGFNIDMKKNV